MKLILVILLAVPVVLAAESNEFKLKANEYFTELTEEIITELGKHENGKSNLLNNYSIEIKGSPFTLSLNNGSIMKLSKISHSGAENVVYTIPAVGSLYSIGDALLHFKYDLKSNSNIANSSQGEVTLKLTGVGISVAVAVYKPSAGDFTANVIKEKLAVIGKLESIELSGNANKNMKEFVELLYNKHSFDVSTAVHREFSSYFNKGVKKVNASKYVE